MKRFYPFKRNFLHFNGLRYHYIDEGQGEPVVMVHGNPTWSFYYRNLVRALRPSFRNLVPDHMGCGFSDKPEAPVYDYTLKERLHNLESLIEEKLSPREKINLVVHDWGGMIGMAYATRHPERIKKLVILNTGAFFIPSYKSLPIGLHLCRVPLLGSFLVRGLNLFCKGAAQVGCKRNPLPPELREAYLAPYNSWKNRVAIHRFVLDIPLNKGDKAYDLVEQTQQKLETLSPIPMLICWGEKDFVFDNHFLEEWKKRFPKAQVHTFPDCGHYILEDAAEEVIPLIESFLKNGQSSLQTPAPSSSPTAKT